MSQTTNLEILKQHREALRLAEVAAWLHMFGKLHEDFLAGNHDLDIKIPDDVPKTLKDLLTGDWVCRIWHNLDMTTPQLQAGNITINTFISHHRERPRNSITGLIQDAHGRGSGIEKGVLNRFAPAQQENVVLSSAMGSETTPIDPDEIQTKRQKFYTLVNTLLDRAKGGGIPLTRKEADRIRQYFQITAADTRRPLNDITLYDQTAASVALFKASLAQVLLTGWKNPSPTNQKDKYQWRILRVGFNGPAFWGSVRGISDLLARKDLTGRLLDRVQEQLEQDCPLGGEVYRDENGSLFIVPDIADLLHFTLETKTSDEKTPDKKTLAKTLQEIAANTLKGEARLELELSEPSRGLKKFGELVVKPLSPPTPTPEWLQTAWETTSSDSENRQICTICGLRPQGRAQRTQQRKVCHICEERRQERSKGWVQNMGDRSTIWMNEIADDNGRLALLVGQFGLEHWLSGEVLNSVMMMDPLHRELVDHKRNDQQYEFDYAQLLKDCEVAGTAPQRPLGKQQAPLLDKLLLDEARGGLTGLGELYDLYVNDTDLHNPAGREGWRLALSLMRQQPSFARIRRVWETTQQFWHTVEQDLPGSVGQAGQRLQITGAFSGLPSKGLDKFHAYALVSSQGITINAVWDPDNNRFISADNLERIARLMGRNGEKEAPSNNVFLANTLDNSTLEIREPGGYESPAKSVGNLEHAVLEPISGSEYIPAIVILKEPRTFMAIVPAKQALTIIEHIRQKYNHEMGKVRNRLPMRLGAVFAPQHTPLRAILDAGWRMLRGASLTHNGWQIAGEAENPHFKHYRNICLQQKDGRQIYWNVPLSMADGKTEDAWYPYAFVERSAPEHPVAQRNRHVKSINPWGETGHPHDLVHVEDLVPGDVVSFTPDTFDFVWLGSAAQRVSIAYDANGQRYELPRRPYLLDELPYLYQIWGTLKTHLSTNQIYILRDTIERKREAWLPTAEESRGKEGVFWQFCRDAVANAQWQDKHWTPAELDRWAGYAVKGWLTDTVELYLHIMKHKPQESPQKEDVHDGIQLSHPPVSADERGPGSHWNGWLSSRQG